MASLWSYRCLIREQHVIKSVPKTLWEWVVKLAQFTKSAHFIYLLGLASFRIFDCIIFLQLFYLSPKNLFVDPCFLLWALVLIYCHGLFLNYIYLEKDTLKNEYSHLRNERKKVNVVGYRNRWGGKKTPSFNCRGHMAGWGKARILREGSIG